MYIVDVHCDMYLDGGQYLESSTSGVGEGG